MKSLVLARRFVIMPVVEIIPKPAEKTPFWPNVLFYISIILLLAAIAGFFLLDSFIKKSGETLSGLEATLTKERTPSETALEGEIFGYQKKIEDATFLLDSHLFSSQFFGFLEKNTHPRVRFSKIDLNIGEYRAKISGSTESFEILGKQILILKRNQLIKNLNLTDVSIGREGEVSFNFDLFPDPKVFAK